MKNGWRINKDLISLIIIVVLCLVFARNFLPFNKEILVGSSLPDAVDLFIAHSLSADSLKNLTIPFWNPYVLCGLPALAEPHHAIFYPLNLIFLIVPINIAYNYSVLLHLILAGIFMYAFARTIQIDASGSLCAAISFVFSSIFSLHIFAGHLNNILTITWLPLIFLFIEKYFKTKNSLYAILCGITLSLQIFSGHLQYVTYTVLASGLFLLFKFIKHPKERPGVIKIGLYIIILGIALSAAQLLPTLEFSRYSTRATNDYAFASSLSFPPENLITIIIPEFFGNALNASYEYWGRWYFWEECIYVGILPLILAIIALKLCKKNEYINFFSLLALLSLVAALGYYIPTLRNILRFIPIFTMFRAHSKFIFLTVFSLSILSGFGMQALFNNTQKSKIDKKQIIKIYVLIVLSLVIVYTIKSRLDFWALSWFRIVKFFLSMQERYWLFEYWNPGFLKMTFMTAYRGVIKFILLSGVSFTLIMLSKNTKIKSLIMKPIFLAFIIIDLWSFSAKYTKVINLPEVLWSEETVKFLKSDDTVYRIINRDSIPNVSSLYKIQTTEGNTALFPQDYADYMGTSSQIFYTDNNVLRSTPFTKNLATTGLKYLIIKGYAIDSKDFKLEFSDNKIKIYRNLNALPRAFMVFKAKTFVNKNSVIAEFESKDFDPKEYVILETTDKNK
ncbi:MAG: hypothetical protein PHI86_02355, partial [Candidatus Omnitrophica bacterium]|nr:hypothetical protein [Candidatus Omnitrophota bacterium]